MSASSLLLIALVATTIMVAQAVPSGFYSWANNWGGFMSFSCPSNRVMNGFYGAYTNARQDRRFSFRCALVDSITSRSADRSYIHSWRQSFTKSCPTGMALSGAISTYSSSWQDSYTTSLPSFFPYFWFFPWWFRSFYWYFPYLYYSYPAVNFQVSSPRVITGIGSIYDARFRDRRWRFRTCQVSCSSGWVRSGTRCVCPSGSFQSGSRCIRSRVCGRGQYATSTFLNRNCLNCRPGTFQSLSSHTRTACTSCPAGQFQNLWGQSGCRNCLTSEYNPFIGQTSCRSCSTGFYRSSPTRQTACQPGYRCPGSCSRVACRPGQFQDKSRQTTCLSCRSGKYQPSSAQRSCIDCPPGFYTTSSAGRPIRCQVGFACSSCNRRRCTGENFQDQAGQDSCKRARTCPAGTLVSRNPTSSTDRQCSSCRRNVNFQDATDHRLGSCRDLHNCPAGYYVHRQPTVSSDRECRSCEDGKFSSSVNSAQCTTLGTCRRGEYAQFKSGSTGIICKRCTIGVDYQDDDRHQEEECKPVRADCPRGKFQAVAPTISSDRDCRNCPSGKYSDSPDSKKCTEHTVCALGYIATREATPTTDRRCRRCDGTTEYQDQREATSCKSVTTCESGKEYETQAPSPTNNRRCATCRTTCPSGSTLFGECAGRNNPTCVPCHASCGECKGTRDDQCTSCDDPSLELQDGKCVLTECDDGFYLENGGCVKCHDTCFLCDGAGPEKCIACSGSRYLNGHRCSLNCQNAYFKKAGDDNKNNICERCSTCADGTFSSRECDGTHTSDVICHPWDKCGVGEREETVPSSNQNRVCVSCKEGEEYQDEPNKSFCKSVTVCAHGEYVSAEATVSTDRLCLLCPVGTFSNTNNAEMCLPCATGTYQDETGQPSCKECGIGSFQPEQGKTTCTEIPEGYFGTGGTVSTRTNKQICPPGYFCLGGSHDKRPCPPTQYQPNTGQHECFDHSICQAGQFVEEQPTSISNRKCKNCPAGTFEDSETHESTECMDWMTCPPGTRVSQAGSRVRDRTCEGCNPPDTFQSESNEPVCKATTPCPVGQVERTAPTGSTDRTCSQCEEGETFADASGLSMCKPVSPCNPGYYEVNAPTISSDRQCLKCASGKFTETENEKTCREILLCGPGERQVQSPSTSSNRRCAPCDGEHYQDMTGHSSTSCKDITVCQPGTFLSAAATITSDAVCVPCEKGKTFSNSTNAGECLPISYCGRGERQKLAPTTSSNRICEACPEGMFQNEESHSQPSCREWSTCPAGEYILEPASAVMDRVCDDCSGVVTYQPRANQDTCLNVTICDEGYYELTPPAPNKDRVCGKCRTQGDCNVNEYLDGECGDDDGKLNPRCAACHPTCRGCTGPEDDKCIACHGHLHFRNGKCVSDCSRGEFEDDGKCSQCDSTCLECDGGSAKDCTKCSGSQNLLIDGEAQTCESTCPTGYFARDNRCVKCTTCESGFWASSACSASSDTECSAWTKCQPGERESLPGDATKDRQCVKCKIGEEYQPLPGRTHCFPTTQCSGQDIETVAPTLTTDRSCSCDTLSCHRLAARIYREDVCTTATEDQLTEAIEWCCAGLGEDGVHDLIKQSDAYKARRSCPGCTETCSCSAGFIELHDSRTSECVPCDGVDHYAPESGMDRCLRTTQCQRGYEQVTEPTSSSNRVCRRCPAGYIDDDGDPLTPCKICDEGHFTISGSVGDCDRYNCRAGTHDHDEDSSTPCEPCTLGETFQDDEGKTFCKNVTECPSGEEEIERMTLISDRVCRVCPNGKYKSISGHDVPCVSVTECDEGFEETEKPTASSDRDCTRCKDGFFKPRRGQDEKCQPVTVCDSGYEESRSPTHKHDRECRSCQLGVTYRPSDSDSCVPVRTCTASQFISVPATLTTDAECQNVQTCELGFFQSRPPTTNSDRKCSQCRDCPDGRFMIRPCSAVEDTQCNGCRTCAPGYFISQACNAESNTVCAKCRSCPSGQYRSGVCTRDQDTTCSDLTVCNNQNEYQVVAPTDTSNRVCMRLRECVKDEEYQELSPTLTTDRVCHRLTRCVVGQQIRKRHTSESDRECETCPAGQTDHDLNPETNCVSCPIGSFVPKGSIGPCSQFECPHGTADKDEDPSTPCERCKAGEEFAANPGQRSCTPVEECDIGYEEVVRPSVFANRQCRRCLEGMFYRSADLEFCARVSICHEDEFEEEMPTVSSDRKCQQAQTCGNGTYVTQELSPFRDRTCTPWTECIDDEYESRQPSSENNRLCRPIRECGSDEYEIEVPTATTDRLCARISSCPSEEFEVQPPTSTSDRVCALAFSTELNFAAPFNRLAATQTQRDEFIKELTQVINNTLDASQILRVDLRAGSIIATVASFSDDFIFELFNLSLSGSITVKGYTSAPCGLNAFLDEEHPNPFAALVCTPLTTCHQNEFEFTSPTVTTDRDCRRVSVCPPEYTLVEEFTATTDRVCEPPPEEQKESKSTGLNAGMTAVVSVLAVLALVAIAIFFVYRSRQVAKDRRQNQAIQQWASMTKDNDDISQANTLLRQLTLRDQSVLLFDNPMFSQPGSGKRPDWYVGAMTRGEAEDHIKKSNGQVGDFVVRESASNGNFVLTLMIDGGNFEHHKLFKDVQGRFLLNGNRTTIDCMTLDQLINHLSRHMDGTSALLNVQDSYGQVKVPQASDDGEFYGAVTAMEPEFYGSVVKDGKPPYMYGVLARGEAEAILAQDRTKGNFLIRESKARPGTYAISLVIDDGRVEHHTLRNNGTEFVLNDLPMSKRCTSIDEVVHHLATNEETMTCTLRLGSSDMPEEIPGFEGFSNPLSGVPSAGHVGQYDPLTAPRGVVANPGYDDLPCKPVHLIDDSYASATTEDDGPPMNVRTLPKPYHLLPPKPDTNA